MHKEVVKMKLLTDSNEDYLEAILILKIKNGETTPDGKFTLTTLRCVGACGLAPVVVINEKVYPQMTPDAISIVLDTLMKEEQ